ncbi:YicC family protein [Aquimarina sp. MMG015]|uniref:YicC/YloC family endoribonuclease n=1 Tax=unclassified Aquimarina TaxID=2627091 RepID=UPI000E472C1F|nr:MULTISPECIES: YicC/YloC family endoribonuclease [unclassified Aquimarina]AXT57416.1 YicC family protein [Aquimarina sp. AD1]MBQ4801328.1 YicC family protein [Aquimarina sp. MMG015]RKN32740.1 YicC family protein [Aquimarina sp. AD1]
MIKSMTGFGKSILQLPTKKITIEVKSLNSKNLDLNARIPSQYREKELEMRKTIAKTLERGKVDFSLYVEVTGEENSTKINESIVKDYMKQLGSISVYAKQEELELIKMAVRMPDALKTERAEVDKKEFEAIKGGLSDALKAIENYRLDEGKALEKDFITRVKNIGDLLEKVIAIDPERIEVVRERLHKAVSELKEQVDENRFEQELVYYLEKFDITEEKVRLANHLEYFTTTINTKDSNGKKLGFITQEIGREINTIGSKSNYAPMQQLVVQMKDELEKIKEQLLNIL